MLLTNALGDRRIFAIIALAFLLAAYFHLGNEASSAGITGLIFVEEGDTRSSNVRSSEKVLASGPTFPPDDDGKITLASGPTFPPDDDGKRA